MNNVIVTLCFKTQEVDIEIPMNITCEDLIAAMNETFRKGQKQVIALRADNPVAYLCGEAILYQYELHHGTKLYFIEE